LHSELDTIRAVNHSQREIIDGCGALAAWTLSRLHRLPEWATTAEPRSSAPFAPSGSQLEYLLRALLGKWFLSILGKNTWFGTVYARTVQSRHEGFVHRKIAKEPQKGWMDLCSLDRFRESFWNWRIGKGRRRNRWSPFPKLLYGLGERYS